MRWLAAAIVAALVAPGVVASGAPAPVGDLAAPPTAGAELPPDPEAWTLDAATGAAFRRATAREIEANGWGPGTHLVVGQPLEAGAGSLRLIVPLSDDEARPLDLALAAQGPGPSALALRLDAAPEAFVPVVFEYLPASDAPEVGGVLTVASPGGVYGLFAFFGRDVEILGHDSAWSVDPVLLPGPGLPDVVSYLVDVGPLPDPGPVPCATPEPIVVAWSLSLRVAPADVACAAGKAARRPQCSDGVDNDGDRWSDYPRDPGCSSAADRDELDRPRAYPVGLLGEMKWCTRHAANWVALLVATGAEISGGFAANGGTLAAPFVAHTQCWVAATLLDALACDVNGGCRAADGHAYPYNGCAQGADCYHYASISDAAHGHGHTTFPRLSNVQVIHDGTMNGNFLNFLGVCGQADPVGPRSVAIGRPYLDLPAIGCKDFVSTHEVGHNFGASHDNALSGGCGTVMAESYAVDCRWDYFSDLNRREINACVRAGGCLAALY